MFIVEYACSAEPAVVNRLIILITGNLKYQMFLYTVLNISCAYFDRWNKYILDKIR